MSKKPTSPEAKLRHAEERIRTLEDAILSFTTIPVEYLSWLGAAEYAAQNGVSGDSEGNTMQMHAESSGTSGPGWFPAMLLVEEERKAMRRRSNVLKNRLIELVGGDKDRVGDYE